MLKQVDLTLKSRMKHLIDVKCNGSVADFTRITGLSNGFLHHLKDKMHRESFNRIFYSYPDIDRDWLEFGIGEAPKRKTKEEDLNNFIEALHELEKKATLLKQSLATQGQLQMDLVF